MTANNTDEAALLPVTQADRELAERLCFGMSKKAISQAAMLIARHRISHSLPGDVGMREALANACDFIEAMIDANDYVGTGSGAAAKLEEREDRESLAEFRAALTPSALSGDAGETQSWQQPYADAGHDIASVFNPMTTKCKRCGTPQIDLSEDLAYGPMRQCRATPIQKGFGDAE